MKMIKRINPFYYGAWRGENTHCKYEYLLGSHVYHEFMPYNTVKQFFGDRFEDFKKFNKAMEGSPKRVRSGYGPNPKWVIMYRCENVWDRALTWRMADPMIEGES